MAYVAFLHYNSQLRYASRSLPPLKIGRVTLMELRPISRPLYLPWFRLYSPWPLSRSGFPRSFLFMELDHAYLSVLVVHLVPLVYSLEHHNHH